ncbi:MAG: succinylglutamate desuccinylase/aspartoacylase family protein [Gammaproteobacteria bacterium]|nr:succinylglutamate desuccinylase/aspartoacylase family protein [Gammaproteobacteria bacterium]MDE0412543.1 succinylglutamate desuccinylase/aspartoacylase family protein [Gammaproteobacteria bacterium]
MATELAGVLNGPTLFDLSKPDAAPLFISVLLHGNETSGWEAVRKLLLANQGLVKSSSMLVFVGNVLAAEQAVRKLDDQPDYNRIWKGGCTAEHKFAADVISFSRSKMPWCTIDIHNNSGPNPHYSVITDLNPATLTLASAFSSLAILARQPPGTLTNTFSDFCTSIAIETGMPTDPESAERASRLIEQLLREGPPIERPPNSPSIFCNDVRVTVEPGAANNDRTFPELNPELDAFNFKKLPAGSLICNLKDSSLGIRANNAELQDVTADYFVVENSEVRLRQDVIMSMYTRDPLIASQDCICYFLKPMSPARQLDLVQG